MYLELGPAFDPSPLQNFMAQMMENPPFINHVLERAKIVHTIFLSWKVRSAKKGANPLRQLYVLCISGRCKIWKPALRGTRKDSGSSCAGGTWRTRLKPPAAVKSLTSSLSSLSSTSRSSRTRTVTRTMVLLMLFMILLSQEPTPSHCCSWCYECYGFSSPVDVHDQQLQQQWFTTELRTSHTATRILSLESSNRLSSSG